MTIIKLHASTWVNLIQHYAQWKKQEPEEYILKKDIHFKNKPKIHIMVGRYSNWKETQGGFLGLQWFLVSDLGPHYIGVFILRIFIK